MGPLRRKSGSATGSEKEGTKHQRGRIPPECSVCGKEFQQWSTFCDHYQTHCVQCKLCRKKFICEERLKEHVRVHHEKSIKASEEDQIFIPTPLLANNKALEEDQIFIPTPLLANNKALEEDQIFIPTPLLANNKALEEDQIFIPTPLLANNKALEEDQIFIPTPQQEKEPVESPQCKDHNKAQYTKEQNISQPSKESSKTQCVEKVPYQPRQEQRKTHYEKELTTSSQVQKPSKPQHKKQNNEFQREKETSKALSKNGPITSPQCKKPSKIHHKKKPIGFQKQKEADKTQRKGEPIKPPEDKRCSTNQQEKDHIEDQQERESGQSQHSKEPINSQHEKDSSKSAVHGQGIQCRTDKADHLGTYQFKCHICKERFVSASQVNRHLLFHPEKPYKCSQCQDRFTTAGLLKAHTLSHYFDGKYYKCYVCGETCESAYYFEYHLSTHFFKCDTCDLRFLSVEHLDNHMLYQHLEEKDDKDSQIGIGFSTVQMSLNNTESDVDMEPLEECTCINDCDTQESYSQSSVSSYFTCPLCNQKFMSTDELFQHALIHSEKFCSQDISTIGVLEELKSGHLPQKVYECLECNETFRCLFRLKKHSHDHDIRQIEKAQHEDVFVIKSSFTDGNPIQGLDKCTLCIRGFSNKQHLQDHLYAHQTGTIFNEITEYNDCKLCVLGFLHVEDLEEHMEKHPYASTTDYIIGKDKTKGE